MAMFQKHKFYSTRGLGLLVTFALNIHSSIAGNVCHKNEENCIDHSRRYLLYDVNNSEGFNLRRDVYMRLAVLVHKMQYSPNDQLNKFVLVLPPWSHMVHWTYSDYPEQIPWGFYFDINSLRKFAPVIEMHEFFNDYPNKYTNIVIDEVYNLQHFEDMFETGNFQDRTNIEDCQEKPDITYFFYKNISTKHIKCLSFHGPAYKLTEVLLNTTAKTILINHAEVTLHDFFGSRLYWQARRSMRFNKELKEVADEFRKKYLNSTDDSDLTRLPESWTDEKPRRDALGGPYVGVHLRRGDFTRSRSKEATSLKNVSEQIKKILTKLNLQTVFVATDGTQEEINILTYLLKEYHLVKYTPSSQIKRKFKDGGIAIIDQIICSHARYFIGTYESTFSFRIQEEREILSFASDNTYNVFCSENGCQKPSVWEIIY